MFHQQIIQMLLNPEAPNCEEWKSEQLEGNCGIHFLSLWRIRLFIYFGATASFITGFWILFTWPLADRPLNFLPRCVFIFPSLTLFVSCFFFLPPTVPSPLSVPFFFFVLCISPSACLLQLSPPFVHHVVCFSFCIQWRQLQCLFSVSRMFLISL